MRIRYDRDEFLERDSEMRISEPMSDQTAFMRMQTQIEKNDMIDKKFLNRHKSRIIAMDKFAPLSYVQNKLQLQIDRIRRLRISLLTEAGLLDEAEEVALDNIADYQLSRGWHGFYQKAMITQRHVIKETGGEKKLRRLSDVMRGRQKQPEEDEGVDAD